MSQGASPVSERAAIEVALQRAAAGADATAGLAGLDLGPYPRGDSAMDYLIHPSWQEGTSREVWLRVVDWLVDAGADPAAAFQRALDIHLSFIAHHLATRGVLPDPAEALRRAITRRQSALARALVAGGADPEAIADLVRADLVTPARVEVRYRAAEEEQRVTVTVGLHLNDPTFAADSVVQHVSTLFQRLGAVGGLGSDVFEPARSSVAAESFSRREVAPFHFEAVSVLRVRGVAPAGLALVFRHLVGTRTNALPVAVTIEGELPLDESDRSVDTARALRWFRDPDVDRLQAFPSSAVAVSSKAKKKVFAVVDHGQGVGRVVHRALGPIDPEQLGRPEVIGFDAGEAAPMMHFDAKVGDSRTEIVLKSFGGGGAMGDRSLLRAVVQNVVSSVAGVTALTWCDDAGAPVTASEDKPGKKKEVAKKKAPPKAAVATADLGPSLIPELRRALAEQGEPPWVPRRKKATKKATPLAIPATFSDGSPLPPTLREWLAFGDAHLPLSGKAPFEAQTFSALLLALFSGSEEVAEAYEPLASMLFPGACIPLYVPQLCSDDTILFLYPPLADAAGEAPVLGFDFTDDGIVGVFAPRFDHYLARVLDLHRYSYAFGPIPGIEPFVDALLAQLPAAQRKLAQGEGGLIHAGPLVR